MKNFQFEIEKVKNLVLNEIEHKENRPNYILEEQLYLILSELEKMDRIRNVRLFCPYYPHAITDSWDYSNPLGKKLLELFGLYRKLFSVSNENGI